MQLASSCKGIHDFCMVPTSYSYTITNPDVCVLPAGSPKPVPRSVASKVRLVASSPLRSAVNLTQCSFKNAVHTRRISSIGPTVVGAFWSPIKSSREFAHVVLDLALSENITSGQEQFTDDTTVCSKDDVNIAELAQFEDESHPKYSNLIWTASDTIRDILGTSILKTRRVATTRSMVGFSNKITESPKTQSQESAITSYWSICQNKAKGEHRFVLSKQNVANAGFYVLYKVAFLPVRCAEKFWKVARSVTSAPVPIEPPKRKRSSSVLKYMIKKALSFSVDTTFKIIF